MPGTDLTVAMLAKALMSSGADSIHVRAGQVPELAFGLHGRAMPDVPAPGPADLRRLCAGLLPEAKLAEIEHGKRKRLKCHIGQMGSFHVEIGLAEGAFTLVLSPEVGQAELEAALGSATHARPQPAPVPRPPPKPPVVEPSAHPLPDPPLETDAVPLTDRDPAAPLVTASAVRLPKRRTAIFLALFFGEFGFHHFYLGRTLAGWITLAVLVATGGLAAILLGMIAFRDAFRMWRMTDEAFLREVIL